MRAGALRHRITIERRTEAQSASGMPTYTWATFKTANAEIKTTAGREGLAAEQIVSESTHTVRMRYQPGILSDMRVKYHARTFEINHIDNVLEKDAELVLFCKEYNDV